MKVLGIIPARGDSTGCPGKNLRTLGSKHIIDWTIDAALAAGLEPNDLVLSTESDELRLKFQGSLPVMNQGPRTDSPIAVIDKALAWWTSLPEIVLYLQPTTPFKRPVHIMNAIAMIEQGWCDSAVTMMEIPKRFHPTKAFWPEGDFVRNGSLEAEYAPMRQKLGVSYARTGDVYAFRTSAYLKRKCLYERCKPILVDAIDYCNIDTEEDWLEAEWRAAEIERCQMDAQFKSNGRWYGERTMTAPEGF